MTVEQLWYFVTLAELKSFSRTAEKLNISQSSVTKQLRALEQEWGVVLFDCNNRHVELSQIGGALYPQAKKVLTELDSLVRQAAAHTGQAERRVSIAALPFMGQYELPRVLLSFESLHPKVEIHLEEMEENDMLEALKSDAYDLCITREEMVPAGINSLCWRGTVGAFPDGEASLGRGAEHWHQPVEP